MKKKTGLQVLVCLLFYLLIWTGAYAADLPGTDEKLIKSAGVPIYSDAEFVNGNHDVGFRFATSNSPEDVRALIHKAIICMVAL